MSAPRTRFVLITLGAAPHYYWQAWYAILTTLAHAPADSELCVVTDHAQRFSWFGDAIQVRAVTTEQVASWSGPQQFRWRFKPMAMLHALGSDVRRLVYLDSDVQCLADLAPLLAALDQGAVHMHLQEYVLSRNRRRGNRRLWAQVAGRSFAGVQIGEHDAMWNAGVIAVGAQRTHLLSDALSLCDALCANGAMHNLSEQFAFSVTLQRSGDLRPASAWFDHYWGNKIAWQRAILERMAEVFSHGMSLAEAQRYVKQHPITAPLSVRRRWWNKLAARFAALPE